MGAGINRNNFDQQHVRMQKSLRRQSERDDGSKCQASERRGNLFSLACIAFTDDGKIIKEGMQWSEHEWRNFLLFIGLYLAMEEWFHTHNKKENVRNACRKIGRVLKMLQDLFPCGEGANGNNIPKMHGMAKMQYYMKFFGCAMNFFGGPGESSHKQFVKAPAQKTQRRVSEFAMQVAKQYGHVMVAQHMKTCLEHRRLSTTNLGGCNSNEVQLGPRTVMEGKYTINLSDEHLKEKMAFLHKDLVDFLLCNGLDISRRNEERRQIIAGYTRTRSIDEDGNQTIFYTHPAYRGAPWYDWAYVHFVEKDEEVHYPSKVLGFIQTCDGIEAVIQCSTRPVKWSTVERKMFVEFELGVMQESFVNVSLSSFVYSLCVIQNYGGSKNKYMVVLPRSGWGHYFGNDIV